MEEKPFKITDESGDRTYFTIVPNLIVNHSTAYEQSLYLVMKRIAGEHGSCFASTRYIAEKMGTSPNTVKKYRKKLVERGWIQLVGEKEFNIAGVTQKTSEYKIVDLWQLNAEKYGKGKGGISTSDRGVYQTLPSSISTVDTKEEKIKKKSKISEKSEERKDVKIIEIFASFKGIDWEDPKLRGSFIRRHLRAAKDLEPYSIEKITKVMEWLKTNADYKWVLSTVGKFIDENVADLEKKQMSVNSEWKCQFGYKHKDREQCGHDLIGERSKAKVNG